MNVTRASFLAFVGATLAAPTKAFGDIRDDLRILSFALTVEYVQASMYREALKRTPGLSASERRALGVLRDTEVEHVDALRATINDAGGNAGDRRRVQFGVEMDGRDTFLKLANTL